jgi:hypothetical protein
MGSDLPFEELNIDKDFVCRKFYSDVESNDLKWHRDGENRIIRVKDGNGWLFQFDNDLPFELKENKEFIVEKGVWHRLIKGYGNLIIYIRKF